MYLNAIDGYADVVAKKLSENRSENRRIPLSAG